MRSTFVPRFIYIMLLQVFLVSSFAFGEGTKEVRPDSTNTYGSLLVMTSGILNLLIQVQEIAVLQQDTGCIFIFIM